MNTEPRELLNRQIVVQVTRRTKAWVNLLYPAYGLRGEADLIRLALDEGKTLKELGDAKGIVCPD